MGGFLRKLGAISLVFGLAGMQNLFAPPPKGRGGGVVFVDIDAEEERRPKTSFSDFPALVKPAGRLERQCSYEGSIDCLARPEMSESEVKAIRDAIGAIPKDRRESLVNRAATEILAHPPEPKNHVARVIELLKAPPAPAPLSTFMARFRTMVGQ